MRYLRAAIIEYRSPMRSRDTRRRYALLVVAAAMVGCAGAPRQHPPAAPLANHASPFLLGPEACRAAITAPIAPPADAPALDPQRITVFVWNIRKGTDPLALVDLARLAGDTDLVLIQEARLEQWPATALGAARYWTFAPGYRTADTSTGVMTMSHTAPLTHCYLRDREPWLRSPKAISITRFDLAATDETLAVVNVHALNFTLGIADFRRQMAKVAAVLEHHDGPVILAGDFNTWRGARLTALLEIAERLRLYELTFDVDHRARPLGAVVDRIFVRHLYALDASTQVVDTSDHNPLSVTLSM
jgi:endonuclease/exonuclease/phosphatase (EEP) superfamily protein YafD